MVTFFDIGAEFKLGKNNKLVKLSQLINWKRISNLLAKVHDRDEKDIGHGGFSYDKLKMFKAVLLGQWHSLSDALLEEALRVRLDFMKFTEFTIQDDTPDETTLCRFRNKLIAKKLDQKLFKEINKQLEQLGLKIENAKAAVVDATIIESAARPNRVIEISEDREEDDESSSSSSTEKELNCSVSESVDQEAKWLKKGKKSYYGYKSFVATDEVGYVESLHVTPANHSETRELERILPSIKGKRLYADKGYTSKENRSLLKQYKIKDGIMHKASKNKALSRWQKLFNKQISKTRYIVEQFFGTLKSRFGFRRSSYFGMQKVSGQMTFKAICYNLNKALNMLKIA